MGRILLLLSLLVLIAARADAQVDSAVSARRLTLRNAAVGQGPLLSPQPTRRCCSLKGAVIGAAIGAGIGLTTWMACDGSDCTSGTVKAMAILGGIGAGIGVMTKHASRHGPLQREGVNPRIAVVPLILRSNYGGRVTVRF